MPWVSFTDSDVKARLATLELETYESSASQGDEDARLPIIVSQVLGQFRGAIRANPQTITLGPEGTLPDFCIAWAAVIARVALLGLTPVQEGMTDPRRDEYRDATKGLESIRSMNAAAFTINDPSAPDATSSPAYGGSALLDF